MVWTKKGVIYNPTGEYGWNDNTALTPTPYLLNENVIRVYTGFRDKEGASRIGYVDVSAANPGEVISVPQKPVIELGQPGMFDDNGMILGDVVAFEDTIRLYYVGFQIPSKVKFMAFSGVAISQDGGETFQRYSQAPIMDRTENALFIRAIHTVLYDQGKWKIWYSVGNGWKIIDNIPYPQYDIRYVESKDGLTIEDKQGIHCLSVGPNEYRIGRPRVSKDKNGGFIMRFTSDTLDKKYKAGIATSTDGINWMRQEDANELPCSTSGWDSEMACYPVELEAKGKRYLFYSGNGMGSTGVGYAEWSGE